MGETLKEREVRWIIRENELEDWVKEKEEKLNQLSSGEEEKMKEKEMWIEWKTRKGDAWGKEKDVERKIDMMVEWSAWVDSEKDKQEDRVKEAMASTRAIRLEGLKRKARSEMREKWLALIGESPIHSELQLMCLEPLGRGDGRNFDQRDFEVRWRVEWREKQQFFEWEDHRYEEEGESPEAWRKRLGNREKELEQWVKKKEAQLTRMRGARISDEIMNEAWNDLKKAAGESVEQNMNEWLERMLLEEDLQVEKVEAEMEASHMSRKWDHQEKVEKRIEQLKVNQTNRGERDWEVEQESHDRLCPMKDVFTSMRTRFSKTLGRHDGLSFQQRNYHLQWRDEWEELEERFKNDDIVAERERESKKSRATRWCARMTKLQNGEERKTKIYNGLEDRETERRNLEKTWKAGKFMCIDTHYFLSRPFKKGEGRLEDHLKGIAKKFEETIGPRRSSTRVSVTPGRGGNEDEKEASKLT